MLQIICKAPPPPPHHRHSAAAYLLVRACFSVPACESFSRSWSSTVFFSSLLGRHVNRDWKRAAEVRQRRGRAGHGRRGQAYWSSPQQKKKEKLPLDIKNAQVSKIGEKLGASPRTTRVLSRHPCSAVFSVWHFCWFQTKVPLSGEVRGNKAMVVWRAYLTSHWKVLVPPFCSMGQWEKFPIINQPQVGNLSSQ